MHELDDGGGGFLDGAAGDVNDGPAAAGAEAFGPEDFGFDGILVDIVAAVMAGAGAGVAADHAQAVAADVDERFGVDGQADDGAMGVGQGVGFAEGGDEGDVGGFDAAVGEIKAGGGFGGAGDADEDHVGFGDAGLGLTVIMGEDVVDGVDAFEVILVEHVLAAGAGGSGGAELFLEEGEDGIQHMDDADAEALAGEFEFAAQAFFHQGGEHGTGFGFDAVDDFMDLEAGSDEGPAMIDDAGVIELGNRGTGNSIEGIAGGIGDQMKIDVGGHGLRIAGISAQWQPHRQHRAGQRG